MNSSNSVTVLLIGNVRDSTQREGEGERERGMCVLEGKSLLENFEGLSLVSNAVYDAPRMTNMS